MCAQNIIPFLFQLFLCHAVPSLHIVKRFSFTCTTTYVSVVHMELRSSIHSLREITFLYVQVHAAPCKHVNVYGPNTPS